MSPPPVAPIHLAVFGKHPGGDDLTDEVGMDRPRIRALKRSLYQEGMNGNMDGWGRLDPAKRLAGFAHTFAWRDSRALVVGRLWESRGGKGQTVHPMCACAEGTDASLPWLLSQILPTLTEVEAGCKATADRDAITALLARHQAALRQATDNVSPAIRHALPEWIRNDHVLATVADWVGATAAPVGFHRVYYKITHEMSAYRDPWIEEGDLPRPPQHIRVPSCVTDESKAIALWMAMMLTLLHPSTPLLLLLPDGMRWLDILVGEPKTAQWQCLLASPREIPLACDIPYALDPAFVANLNQKIADWRRGDRDVDPNVLQLETTAGTAKGL